jgi:hypothetical protein
MNVPLRNILVLCIVIISMPACGTPSAVASPTELPPTIPPMVEPLQLTSTSFNENSDTPIYTITAEIPTLADAQSSNVQAFNARMKGIVDEEIAVFKLGTTELPAELAQSPSSFDVSYQLISQKANIWSVQLHFMGYMAGAAHPYTFSRTVNFDLQNSVEIQLEELFLPSSNYLEVISEYCKAELSRRDIGFEEGFQVGASAAPENYRNWNLSEDGLVITFDQGQVTAYAVGPQTVVVPFDVLQDVIDVEGPLAAYSLRS